MNQNMQEQLKEYIKYSGDDETVIALCNAAIEKAESETGKRFALKEDGEPESDLYWLAVKMMTAHWYDNRGIASDKPQTDIPMSAGMILDHIALCGIYPKYEETE
ncbi:head-tail connector protein [Senimuribacter intestinalis]|uniref:head-tail connector protein n=1 Tax=Senimuribacter intestinalis TaxID=2941507 RepID=UPI00203AFDB4|nr:head-tail connector protein [Senimuribacter intestinalis]